MVLQKRCHRSRNVRGRQGAGLAYMFCRWNSGKAAVVGGCCRFHATASSRGKGRKLNPVKTRKTNILVLLPDESPHSQATLSRTFNSADCEILWVADVNEALDAIMQHCFDLLVLDLNRPLRSGWGIFERLTTLNRGVPVVLLTDQRAAHEESAATQVGAVVQKAFSAVELKQSVVRLLHQPTTWAMAAASPAAGIDHADINAADFRESMHERYITPLNLPSAQRHWGINE